MVILKNASLIADDNNLVRKDILIDNDTIVKIDEEIIENGAEEINCDGKLIMPGFIDAHVHLREPGFESKETVKTGTMAAAAGGFTTIMPMPNLKPVPDCVESMRPYMELLERDAVVNVLPYASITKGEKGAEVVDMERLLEMGAVAFSDDGVGVQNDDIMKKAMTDAKAHGTMIVAHTEDNTLKNGGYVHEGSHSKKMGWRGIPSACEYAQVERDIELVRETGCRYHVCHVSTKETIEMVRRAKKDGLKVTCEITPHHLTLVDEDIVDSNWKMNPPLRSREDREALIEAINDGTADIIATDHAPHTAEEKGRGLEKAPFGIVGLETAFAVVYTYLVKKGIITLKRVQEIMCEVPAELFKVERRGRIKEGFLADLVMIDIENEYEIKPEEFKSLGKNTPYGGKKVFGRTLMTMLEGKVVYDVR